MHVLTQRETRERLFKCPKSLKNKRSPRAPYKNGEFGDYRCFFCLLHEVLCFKSKYRAQTISLIWIEDQFAVISSVLSQEMRKVYGAMSPSYEQNQPKRCKMHSILCTCGIVSCAGESFGVLRLETSPQTSFSNGNLIEQYLRSQNIPCPYTIYLTFGEWRHRYSFRTNLKQHELLPSNTICMLSVKLFILFNP